MIFFSWEEIGKRVSIMKNIVWLNLFFLIFVTVREFKIQIETFGIKTNYEISGVKYNENPSTKDEIHKIIQKIEKVKEKKNERLIKNLKRIRKNLHNNKLYFNFNKLLSLFVFALVMYGFFTKKISGISIVKARVLAVIINILLTVQLGIISPEFTPMMFLIFIMLAFASEILIYIWLLNKRFNIEYIKKQK